MILPTDFVAALRCTEANSDATFWPFIIVYLFLLQLFVWDKDFILEYFLSKFDLIWWLSEKNSTQLTKQKIAADVI